MIPPDGIGISATRHRAPSEPATTSRVSSTRLKDAAHQFEASLMNELMEPMQHNVLGDEDSDRDGSVDALNGYAREALAKAISMEGGFGIAGSILHHFETAAATGVK